MASTAAETQWILYLLQDFKIQHQTPALIFYDNASAIQIAKNTTFLERTKHLEIDCHFIRGKIQVGIIHLMNVSSKCQLADMLTKPLHTPDFERQLSRLKLISIQ